MNDFLKLPKSYEGSSEWIVTCEDGIVRHSEGFATRGDAIQWSNTGHFCTNTHRFVEVAIHDDYEDFGPVVDLNGNPTEVTIAMFS